MLRSLRTRRGWWPAAVLAVCLLLMANSYGSEDNNASKPEGTKAPAEKKEKAPPPAPKCSTEQVEYNKQVTRDRVESTNGDWDPDAEMAALDQLWGGISGWCHLWHNAKNTAFGLGGLSDPVWNHRRSGGRSDNPNLQATVGLDYIRDTHGSPQAAWAWWNCTENCKLKHEIIPKKEKGAKEWY